MRNPKKINQIVIMAVIFSLAYSTPPVFALGRRHKEISSDLRKPQGLKLSPAEEISLINPPEYFLGEDDVLDISVWQYRRPPEQKENKAGKEEYLIARGDTLEISVWQWPDMLKDVIVRPDGKISYPLVGDIDAEGITLTRLRDILTEKLKDYIKSPQVSIMVKQFGVSIYGAGYTGKIIELPFVKIDELSTTQLVRPDGKITFPPLGDIEVKGLTVNQLSQILMEKISTLIKDIRVTVSIKQFGGRKIIVLGEVTSPGVYKPSGEVTLLEAIALAGGYTKDAILRNVVVISGALDKPEPKVYNVLATIKNGDLSQNAIVRVGNIVYVPASHISNINHILTQLIGPLSTASSAVPEIRTIRQGTSFGVKK